MDMQPSFEQELAWTKMQMSRLRQVLTTLPDLEGVRLAFSIHLDLKIVPLMEGLLERGTQLFVTTCNPSTVRDEVAHHLQAAGATVEAYYDMPQDALQLAIEHALDWTPTHLCEIGADLTTALHQRQDNVPQVNAGLEATGSGIERLTGLKLRYPVFNWDDLPIKEGLHNRRMAGLTTWHTFFERTRLTLHGKRVLVVGYGSVGRGVADGARAYGGTVCVAEKDPARALEAEYAGWKVQSLEEAIPEAEIIVTATGSRGVVNAGHLPLLNERTFLLNVGHRSDEIDVDALRAHPYTEVLLFVEEFDLGDRVVYLIAGGAMANLTAGHGDSLNAFDVTVAVMTAGISHIAAMGSGEKPGVYILPREVWETILE